MRPAIEYNLQRFEPYRHLSLDQINREVVTLMNLGKMLRDENIPIVRLNRYSWISVITFQVTSKMIAPFIFWLCSRTQPTTYEYNPLRLRIK